MCIWAHVQMLLVWKASWLEGRWWTQFHFALSSSKSSSDEREFGICFMPLDLSHLSFVCMCEVRDEQSLNSFAWLGFPSRAGRCRGYVWSNFVLTVVEQCLLLHVSCLTLRVSIWTVGPGAKEQRSGKAIVPDASLARHSNELKQQNVPSACLLCCWNCQAELPIYP